jgi:hypothetical protein
MTHKVKIKQVDLSGVNQDNTKTRFLVIDSGGNLSWRSSLAGGTAIDVKSQGTTVVSSVNSLDFAAGFTISSGGSGVAIIEPFKFTSDLPVSLSNNKSFGKFVNGNTIPATGLTPQEVIQLALVEALNPTVSLSSSTSIQFNQTSISNVLNFSYTINTLGATVASAVLEWRRGGSSTWSTLSTSTTSSGTYTHSLTDTNYNTANFNYRYTVTDSAGASAVSTVTLTPADYVPVTISLTVNAGIRSSPETDLARESGNVSSVISGSITRNSVLVNLSTYSIQYMIDNNGTWIDVPGSSNVSIGPGSGSITVITHNDSSLSGSTSISYRIISVDDYRASLSTFDASSVRKVNFYYMIFYGPSSSAPTDSAGVRALTSKQFINGPNPFNLLTGTTERIFTVALPASSTIAQVLDLDSLSANITSNYVLSTFNVNTYSGTASSYNVYTMTNSVAYSTGGTPAGNHRHQITR